MFLTQSHPKQTEGTDVHAGTSLDQIYAQQFGQDTPIPSMQLSIENVDQAGGCAYGYSCVYTDTISWASPTQPLPMIRDPRVVFDQLFGVGATPRSARPTAAPTAASSTGSPAQVGAAEARARRRATARGSNDYLDDIREIERRIQHVEARNASGERARLPDAPIGVPDSFEEHVQSDVRPAGARLRRRTPRACSRSSSDATRSGRVYPESGVTTGFHNASHHGEREDRILDFAKINRYHVSMVPYLLDKLKNTPDGDGNLLDNSLIIYGSPMGDSNIHNHKRVPAVPRRPRRRQAEGRRAHQGAGRHADGERDAHRAAHARAATTSSSFGDSTGELDLNNAPAYRRPTAGKGVEAMPCESC